MDDEVEERLYVRELVASKFQETSYPRRADASSEGSAPRVTARRVDLSAPKFRTSRRRRVAVHTSLECGTDGRQSRERAPLAGTAEDSKDSESKDDEATARDSQATRRRVSSAAGLGLVHPDVGGVCRIQTGPSVNINGELTRQDLEDVHISPEPTPGPCERANVATYVVRRESAAEENRAPAMTTSKARPRARSATASSREKRERLAVTEAVIETATASSSRQLEENIRVVAKNKDSDYDGENEHPTTSQIQGGAYGEERSDEEEVESRDAGDAETPECSSGSLTNGEKEANDEVAVERPAGVIHVEIAPGDNVESRRTTADDGGGISERSGVDSPARRQNEERVADKIRTKNRGDQSKPPADDVSRRASFPRRENIARPCRTTASPKQYRTIDGRLSYAFNSHDGPAEPCDGFVVAEEEEIRRARLSSDDLRATDGDAEVELYRPRLDELDSILLSNDKKIERVVRAARTFADLLSKPEFARYKLDGGKRQSRHASRENPSTVDSSGDRDREDPFASDRPTTSSSSVVDSTSRTQGASVSSASKMQGVCDADSRETSVSATETSGFAGGNVRFRDDWSKTSVESTKRPTSGASDASRKPPDEDGPQQPKSKARLSSESSDKSDITTFSNLQPALSSTRTDTQTYLPQQQVGVAQAKRSVPEDRYADAKLRGTSRFAGPASEIAGRRMNENGNVDDILAQILRGLRDETTDRFVACILQDEKRSIEGRVAKVLNESSTAPTAMEKLLARLREADPVGDGATRRTETLDVLKEILINVKNRTDGVVDDEAARDKGTSEKVDSPKVSPRAIEESTLQERDARQTRTRVSSGENGRLTEGSRDPESRDERSETRESARTAAHTLLGSRGDNESKRDSRSEGESLEKISDVLSDKTADPRENSRLSSARSVSVRRQESREMEVDGSDVVTAKLQDEEGNASGEGREYESGEVKDDKDPALSDQRTNKSSLQTTAGRMNDALLDVPSGAIVVAKVEEKKIAAKKIANDGASLRSNEILPPTSDVSGRKDERAESDAGRSRVVDETPAKKDPTRSSIEENVGSSLSRIKDIGNPRADPVTVATNGKVSLANSRSADSLRDCASLRTLSDESPLKKVQSHGQRPSIDVVISTEASNEADDARGDEPVTNGAVKHRANGDEGLALPRSARSNEQLQPVASTLRKSLSSSGSSVSGATLGHDGG